MIQSAMDGHGAGGGGTAADREVHVPHVVPRRVYLTVWAALIGLTGITVAASYFDFGGWNLVIALVVATAKASLVALVFMHLLYDRRFHAIVLVVGLIFLAIFIGFTRMDAFNRGLADAVEGQRPAKMAAPFENLPAPLVAPR